MLGNSDDYEINIKSILMKQKIKDMNFVNNTRGRESVKVTLEQI